MGKRDAQGDSNTNKRAKRHKRHHKKRKSPEATIVDEEDVDVEEQIQPEETEPEAPAVEHEEEIVCDGEVELPLVDDDDGDEEIGCSIDVETAEEEEATETIQTAAISVPATPTPTPPKFSKSGGSAASKKSNSTRHSATPTTAPPSPKPSTSAAAALAASTPASVNAKKSKKRRDSGTSSDEERWLTAIESGKLEDVDDELKKIKDPKLMTARQRAMYERNTQDPDPTAAGGTELLMSLPTGYREKEKPQTAEEIQKAALKSQKRKLLADAKREKDKRKTMERLLKKQESKQRSGARGKGVKAAQPMISYRNSSEAGVCIQMPEGVEFPLRAQVARSPPKPQLCGIAGCGQPKVYNCSKTNLPLCSFACYRKNVQAVRQIMC